MAEAPEVLQFHTARVYGRDTLFTESQIVGILKEGEAGEPLWLTFNYHWGISSGGSGY